MRSTDDAELDLPPRYEAIAPLGRGGGGEVWSVRDRITGRIVALKTLAAGGADQGPGSSERVEGETLALVREAVALSGLEGLGVPRVLRFGRLPESRRPYMVRELVEGQSLANLLQDPPAATTDSQRNGGSASSMGLSAVATVADQLTRLHRAQLLHGDVKPANIIVGPAGAATLVDLGLVAAFREGGTRALGLTPRYAAPELFEGGPLTVRAEVFALGATLHDVVKAAGSALDASVVSALDDVIARATSPRPESRFPSVDELASALRRAARLAEAEGTAPAVAAWPIVGIDEPAQTLVAQIDALPRGGGIVLAGPRLSGRTTLLRRLAWSLGVAGRSVAWVEAKDVTDPAQALDIELSGCATDRDLVVLLDDADRVPSPSMERIADLRENGARLVVVGGASAEVRVPGATLEVFTMPRMRPELARELVLRFVPSLSEAVVAHVVELADGWPGRVRAIVERLHSAPVVAPEDVDRLVPKDVLQGAPSLPPAARRAAPGGNLDAIRSALEVGHFDDAAEMLAPHEGTRSLVLCTLRARLSSNRGDPRRALVELEGAASEVDGGSIAEVAEYFLEQARALLRSGDYPASERAAETVEARVGSTSVDDTNRGDPRVLVALAEASAVAGLAKSFLARHDAAEFALERAVSLARHTADPRIQSVALASLAFALQRSGKLDAAKTAYEEALRAAELAKDAGSVATTRLNLAGIAKTKSDLAEALAHYEAAVDMGRRSGRTSTVRQALLNLANLDLYLGRLSRAQASIEQLAAEREDLPAVVSAQLLALEAEAATKSGDVGRAVELCRACARAYEAMGRPVDAAEARLEAIFASLGTPGSQTSVDLSAMRAMLADAEVALTGTDAHRAALELARGRIALAAADGSAARVAYDIAIEVSSESGKKDWLARAYQARASLLSDEGQRLMARRDREAALAVLEEIAARLPRDLREVYWDDPWRRALRTADASSEHGGGATIPAFVRPMSGTTSVAQDRLARVLEINREIAETYDLKRLLERVTDHAIALLNAERGFVILKSSRKKSPEESDLSIHASRDQEGDDPHARFSQSIADRVIQSGEPIVTTSARDDARMAGYVSVHQLMLQSIACVPIRSRSSGVIGALYLETRLRPASTFTDELPLCVALADQVAIAIETARLVGENERRARELEETNKELMQAREKLEELLGHRTAQLVATRRDLRSARAVLKSHFGYEGLVGTSEAMRRLYALIDRIKDTDVPVLLTGESGTGKEIIARAIHNASPRSKRTFVGINCGAIPEHLLESELFGHVRGAFTGAERDRRGLFREATEGTILLDEIGEMPHKMQAGLLRVLQEKVVRPVGGQREEPVDTRVIAATHRDLQGMVENNSFREDLFYRLNVIQVRVPALRERLDDIPILIDHFLGIFAARYSRERRSVSRGALKMLMGYRWPGNVRQLENALLNAWVLSDAPELEPEDFELADTAGRVPGPPRPPGTARPSAAPPSDNLATSLDAHKSNERERILQALSSCNWNRLRAAEVVGMPRRTFYRRLKEYGIQ